MLKLGDLDRLELELELATDENVAAKLWDTEDVTLWDTAPVTLELALCDIDPVTLELALCDTAPVTLWDRVTVVDSLVLRLDVCVGKTEELNVANDVGDKEMDSDAVREAVMAVVREGEAEAVALIEGVEAAVGERERLWLWLKVEDPDPDTVAIEDMVMELLSDMETLDDEDGEGEGVLLGDTLEEEVELEDVVADTLVL
jgi:hypothetical protein